MATIRVTYSRMRETADRVSKLRFDRARQACKDAGLDPGLLGIHPHNAMCAYESGQPWKGVDYSKVRLSLRLQTLAFEPMRVLERWYHNLPSERIPEVFKD